jgi:hypothetical protein
VFLILSLLVVFFVSLKAGEDRARLDKSDQTTLPTIIFQVRELPTRPEKTATPNRTNEAEPTYHGKLLLLRNGSYFVHGVTVIEKASTGSLQTSIYRAEDIKEVSVVEHQ